MGPHTESNYPFDLGTYAPKISSSLGRTTRIWFNRGLKWCYGFNHEEAARCFGKALQDDPYSPLCNWGLAYALGPNYNKPWFRFDMSVEFPTTRARILRLVEFADTRISKDASSLGPMLLEALKQRVPSEKRDIQSIRKCNAAYADAMERIYQKYSEDADIAALYADALLNITPWSIWRLSDGKPTPHSRGLEAKRVLERARNTVAGRNHPGILHMYIHLMELSQTPELAHSLGPRLSQLYPDIGHLVHMPVHIEVLLGHYGTAIEMNERACRADEKFAAIRGSKDFYTFFRMHNYHSLVYAAMFAGKRQTCIDAARRIVQAASADLLQLKNGADWLESFLSVPIHVWVRFGNWDQLKNATFPADSELYCVYTAMLHYGKGIAFAATNNIEEATKHQDLLKKACKRIPESRLVGNFCISARTVMRIAEDMLAGELEYRKGNYAYAFQCLRDAIYKEDHLPYSEPWAWMQPTRHAYGALLLEQGHVNEAIKAYEQDLGLDKTVYRSRWHPNNIWALQGLHECLLTRLPDDLDYLQDIGDKLTKARESADVDITASCYCKQSAWSCCTS
ncbi:uncharacterized protein EI97DRAFT_383239 [Westerdykella ornata]|uniref:TPR domain protein n=1 Tax=Westerdykella ornata TaxID=318751 RepID=A0A6A6JB09_WESOR|nr:uncharacterized protein EI97DRAFT_383239 [Westerdykella ornata]KAF2273602.1 hypothetical protein EI97DRAFT_383239 [Westerdykella ornata]